MSRHSIRTYTDEPVSDEIVQKLLDAALAAPSCTNAKDWHFLIVRDPETLNQMADANGPPANPLRKAPLGILICGDTERAFKPAPDYWIIDGAIAGENIVLAAHALGLGAVWLGTWPQMERVEGQRALFGLPEHIIPHSVLAIGWPAPVQQPPGGPPRPADDPNAHLHFEKW